jgi:hypothetical protein
VWGQGPIKELFTVLGWRCSDGFVEGYLTESEVFKRMVIFYHNQFSDLKKTLITDRNPLFGFFLRTMGMCLSELRGLNFHF